LESSDINALFQRAEDVERELAITQRSIGRLKVEIKEHLELIDIINGDEQLRDQLHILVEELKEKVENNGKYKVKQKVEQLISDLTPRKDQLISNLIRAESLNSVIQSIVDNIKELEKREKHTLLLMDGLSPVKGLIGYLMNDFLVAVIANMNAVIQPIWSNRLQILNCSTSKSDDDVDLSYIFPAITGDNNTPIKDVGDCSGGEREMVNLAFRWVILQYLGKNCGMPLIMDEVGVALDELHRGRFCSWVAEQYRLDKINQSFLVSHYVNQFGMFTNANVIALNIEGLNIPVKVNSKAIIK
jgi:DNA repair exonuclease SbcCD ATPase subunit